MELYLYTCFRMHIISNSLLMGPGGYKVADFMRAGGIMTMLFLIVSLLMLNVLF